MKQPYKLKDGSIVPGCTTICNMLGKGDNLMNWSHRIGFESAIDLVSEAFKQHKKLIIPKYEDAQRWQDVRDSAGDAGTLAHAMIMSYWTKENIDIAGYSFEQIGQAYFCYNKFLKWPALPDIEPILIETELLSEELGFGGKPDIYARVISTSKKRRIDIKTSSGIYDSYWYQLAGYDILGQENKYPADEHQILWLPKDDRFDDPIRTDLRREKRIFKYLLGIHKERKANEPPF